MKQDCNRYPITGGSMREEIKKKVVDENTNQREEKGI
jgi:hypothetical protein